MPKDNQFQFATSQAVDGVMLLSASMTDFSYGRHAHEEFSFGVTLAGRQDFFTQGEQRHSYPGNVLVFNPDDAHDGESGSDDTLRYQMLYVHPNQLAPFLDAVGVRQAEQFRIGTPVLEDPLLRHQILQLANLVKDEDTSTFAYTSAMFEFAEQLARFDGIAPLTPNKQRDILLLRARDYLYDNLDKEISLDDLSQAFHMSKFHLLRHFKQHFGMTPYQFWLNGRINKARQALLSGKSVQDVAMSFGFNDVSHFNRRFKPIFGTTPRQYQRFLAQR